MNPSWLLLAAALVCACLTFASLAYLIPLTAAVIGALITSWLDS